MFVSRYPGLKFNVTGELQYGWARLSVVIDVRDHITATLPGYAYETIPNKPIIGARPRVLIMKLASLDRRPHLSTRPISNCHSGGD